VPRLPLHRSVDRARWGCDAPLVHIRRLARLARHRDRPCPRVSSFEFVGPFEVKGWKLAGRIVPIAYIAWSLWLVISGLVLLIHDLKSPIG
jgi:hypothetical protein